MGVVASLVCLVVYLAGPQVGGRTVSGAKQAGLGCAFYANVPVLTEVGGIHIVEPTLESRRFVSSIYGLRRGDFHFGSAFDRALFFELFGIPAEGKRIDYPQASPSDLQKLAAEMIRREIVPALDRGDVLSIRARGPFGGPHNLLLVSHRNGKFRYHDPTSGDIHVTGIEGLAVKMLSESKSGGAKLRKRYFSSYHRVSLPPVARTAKPLTLSQLPEVVTLRLTADQRRAMMEALRRKGDAPAAKVADFIAAYPGVDFAVAAGKSPEEADVVSAIGASVAAQDLAGAANVARLALISYQIGARELLPVWIIDGQPKVVTGHALASAEGGAATLTWDDGRGYETVRLGEALARLRESGALIGYVRVPR